MQMKSTLVGMSLSSSLLIMLMCCVTYVILKQVPPPASLSAPDNIVQTAANLSDSTASGDRLDDTSVLYDLHVFVVVHKNITTGRCFLQKIAVQRDPAGHALESNHQLKEMTLKRPDLTNTSVEAFCRDMRIVWRDQTSHLELVHDETSSDAGSYQSLPETDSSELQTISFISRISRNDQESRTKRKRHVNCHLCDDENRQDRYPARDGYQRRRAAPGSVVARSDGGNSARISLEGSGRITPNDGAHLTMSGSVSGGSGGSLSGSMSGSIRSVSGSMRGSSYGSGPGPLRESDESTVRGSDYEGSRSGGRTVVTRRNEETAGNQGSYDHSYSSSAGGTSRSSGRGAEESQRTSSGGYYDRSVSEGRASTHRQTGSYEDQVRQRPGEYRRQTETDHSRQTHVSPSDQRSSQDTRSHNHDVYVHQVPSGNHNSRSAGRERGTSSSVSQTEDGYRRAYARNQVRQESQDSRSTGRGYDTSSSVSQNEDEYRRTYGRDRVIQDNQDNRPTGQKHGTRPSSYHAEDGYRRTHARDQSAPDNLRPAQYYRSDTLSPAAAGYMNGRHQPFGSGRTRTTTTITRSSFTRQLAGGAAGSLTFPTGAARLKKDGDSMTVDIPGCGVVRLRCQTLRTDATRTKTCNSQPVRCCSRSICL